MPNLSNLKTAIQAVIKTNGNNEITGMILQKSFTDFIEAISNGYIFRGIATPSTNPSASDANVFYLASQNGTYTYFGNYILTGGIVIFTNSGTGGAWQAAKLDLNTTAITPDDTINRDIYLECETANAVQIDSVNRFIKITGITRLRVQRPSKSPDIIYSFNNQIESWKTNQIGGDMLLRLYADVVTDISGNQNVTASSLQLVGSGPFVPNGTLYLLGMFNYNGTKFDYFSCKHNIYVDGKPLIESGTGTAPNNPTITLQQGGVTKGQFTLNQPNNQTINFDAATSGSTTDTAAVHCVNKKRGGFNINTVAGRIEISGGGMDILISSRQVPFGNPQGGYIEIPDGNYSYIKYASMFIIIAGTITPIALKGTLEIRDFGDSPPSNIHNMIVIGAFMLNSSLQIEGINIYNNDVKIDGSYFNVGGGAATNLFNPLGVLENMTLNAYDGTIGNAPAGYTASGIITGIVPNSIYTILGLPSNAMSMNMNIRFLDGSNNPIKPYLINGTQATDFQIPFTFPATSVRAPVSASGMQFMLRNDISVVLDLNNIQVYRQ